MGAFLLARNTEPGLGIRKLMTITHKELANRLADGYYDAEDLARRLVLAFETVYDQAIDDAHKVFLQAVVKSVAPDELILLLKEEKKEQNREEHRKFYLRAISNSWFIADFSDNRVRLTNSQAQALECSEESAQAYKEALQELGWETEISVFGTSAKPLGAIVGPAPSTHDIRRILEEARTFITIRASQEGRGQPLKLEQDLNSLIETFNPAKE